MDNNQNYLQNYNQNTQTPVPMSETKPAVYQPQPQYTQQPVYTQPAGQVAKKTNLTLSIISLVCGICSIVFCYIPFIGLGGGIAAIITSGIARKNTANGMNKAGKILGIIGTVFSGICTLSTLVSCVEGVSSSYYTVILDNLFK